METNGTDAGSASAKQTDTPTAAPNFSDPLPEIADNICAQLLFDGEALLKLGEVNAKWHKIVRDPSTWERLNRERFGAEALPLPAPAPARLPGWHFFPGVDSTGNDCASPQDARGDLSPAALAALADEQGGCAFNTNGWVKRDLLPVARWERYSYEPGAGLYVREQAVVQRLGLPPPPPPEAGAENGAGALAGAPARPPDFPGWVFYWLMDSPAHDIPHPATGEPHFRSSCATLDELCRLATAFPGCVAFNTTGALKREVQPQTHWRRAGGPTSWAGLYVRRDLVEARGLLQPTPGDPISPMLRYFQRSHTRLLAARDVDVTWLNNTYLVRRPDPLPDPLPRQHHVAAAAGGGDGAGGSADGGPGAPGRRQGGRSGTARLSGPGRPFDPPLLAEVHGRFSNQDTSGSEDEDAWVGEAGGGGDAAAARRGQPGQGPPQSQAEEASGGEADADAAAAPPAPPMLVVELRSVCWLNLAGRFYGLGPGRYRCVWWLLVTRDCDIPYFNFRAHVTDARPCPIKPLHDAATAASAAPAPAARSAAGAASSSSEHVNNELSLTVVPRAQLSRHAGAGWYGQEAARFEVPHGQVYDVAVTLWNHESNWKSGLMFKELVLEQVVSE